MKTIIAIGVMLSVVVGALAEEADLKVGSVQLPAGFSERMTGTKDSRKGEIAKNKPRFVITYDIGSMSGLHMSPAKKGDCVWFKEQLVNGQQCYIGMQEKGRDKILTISMMPQAGVRPINRPWTYPANFWATVQTEEDIADVILIATSYKPRHEKTEEK